MSKINCRRQVLIFENPRVPNAVEWVSARPKQQLVQPKDPQEQNQRFQGDDADFGVT